MGAMLGTAYGDLAHLLFPGAAGPAGAYGLIGMGAVFAGAARAPITAVLIIFELTGDYRIVLPLMVAIVLAAGMSNLLSVDTIYTLKLRRRGIDLQRSRATNVMTLLSVRDAMTPVPDPLHQSTTLDEVLDRFDREEVDALPVVDDAGQYRGTVTAVQLEAGARDDAVEATAGELAVLSPTVRADQTLDDALRVLVGNDRSGVPVIEGTAVVGWLTHRDVLRAYTNHVHPDRAPEEPTLPTMFARPRPPRVLPPGRPGQT
jgi:CIC family chloride channel protein